MIRRIIISVFFVLMVLDALPQNRSIVIDVQNKPLSQVLLQLREKYDFQFSYSESQLSKYQITLSRTFSSKEEVLNLLLDGLPFQLKKTDEVFIIIPDKKKLREQQKKEQTQISGQIVEAGSSEPLPYSKILINNHPMIADVTGNFIFTASADSSFRVRISHLGYYQYDTLLFSGVNQRFKLYPFHDAFSRVFICRLKILGVCTIYVRDCIHGFFQ